MGDVIQLFRATAFDPDTTKVLAEAYDSAIASLSGAMQIQNPEEFIAQWIIWLAQQGERDVERLRDAALRQVEHEAGKAEIKLHREFLQKVFASPQRISLRLSKSMKHIAESLELLERVDRQLGHNKGFGAYGR